MFNLSKIQEFIYACLPALLILIFSEVAVFLSENKLLAMTILGVLDIILIWWLYQFTIPEHDMEHKESEEDLP